MIIRKNFSDPAPVARNTGPGLLIFILSICVLAFVCGASRLDVYYFAVVGAVYEFLWLPVILLIFALPILAFVFWRKDKFRFPSLYPLVMLVNIITIWLMFY